MERPELDFNALAMAPYFLEACFFLAALLYSAQLRSFVSCLFARFSYLLISHSSLRRVQQATGDGSFFKGVEALFPLPLHL